MKTIKEAFALLGCNAKDRVRGISGVVTSVCFDLYGCVQVILHGPADKDGKLPDSHWLDASRLEVTSGPVMKQPDFIMETPEERTQKLEHGPAEKPLPAGA